jgi:L-amino acid N-acyltransferase YncA
VCIGHRRREVGAGLIRQWRWQRSATMEVSIREARPEDAEAIAAILNPIIATGEYTALDTPVTVEQEREFIVEFPECGVFHVAENPENGAAVGFQTLEPFATYTHAFDHVGVIATFVDLQHHHRGVGSRLFAATIEAGRQRRYEKIFTYVRADNLAALAAYRKHGFRIVGVARRQARFGDRYVDEVIIEKFL